jgi:hypothetical protein
MAIKKPNPFSVLIDPFRNIFKGSVSPKPSPVPKVTGAQPFVTATNIPPQFKAPSAPPVLAPKTGAPPTPTAFAPPVSPEIKAPVTPPIDAPVRPINVDEAGRIIPDIDLPGAPKKPLGAPETPPATPASIKAQQAQSVAEKAISDSLRISPEELSTQEDIENLITSARTGFTKIKGQPIPLPFITGQLAETEQRALDLLEPLQTKLVRLQSARQSSLEASKFALDRADKAAEVAAEIPEVEKLDTDTFVDEKGDTILFDTQTGEQIKNLGKQFEEPEKPAPFTLSPGQVRFDEEGNIIATGGPRLPTPAETQQAIEKAEKDASVRSTQVAVIGTITSLLSNPKLGSVSGGRIGRLGATRTGTAAIRSQFAQLKALTALGERDKLKGSGTISDFEAGMLADSANALNFAIQDDGTIKMSDDEVEMNLKNIRGALLLKSGQTVSAIITDPATGESIRTELTSKDAQDLTLDGNIIDFE